MYAPGTGALTYVNAGQNPPLLRRADGSIERLEGTGIALGMFEGSTYEARETSVRPGDLLILYSDGVTEAENPAGQPFEEAGLGRVVTAYGDDPPADLARSIVRAVEAHAKDSRFTDDFDGAHPQTGAIRPSHVAPPFRPASARADQGKIIRLFGFPHLYTYKTPTSRPARRHFHPFCDRN